MKRGSITRRRWLAGLGAGLFGWMFSVRHEPVAAGGLTATALAPVALEGLVTITVYDRRGCPIRRDEFTRTYLPAKVTTRVYRCPAAKDKGTQQEEE